MTKKNICMFADCEIGGVRVKIELSFSRPLTDLELHELDPHISFNTSNTTPLRIHEIKWNI